MDDLYEKFFTKALKFLGFRPRSEKEIRDNLLKKNAPSEIIERVIEELKEQKFLDDKKFVTWWIEQRTEFKPRSLRLIIIELKQKGISKSLIEEAVEELQYDTKNDVKNAKKIVQSRIHRFKSLSKYELIQKLGPQLARSGFSYEVIKRAIDEIFQNEV